MGYKDPEERRKYHKEYRVKNRIKLAKSNRAWNLRTKYNLTLEQYNDLLEVQEQCCALCKRHKDTFRPGYSLHVDHDHTTGEIRGIVCYRCNLALANGLDWFERGVEYLTTKPTYKSGEVVRKPDVTEIDKNGKVVYN